VGDGGAALGLGGIEQHTHAVKGSPDQAVERVEEEAQRLGAVGPVVAAFVMARNLGRYIGL
jgi:uncharacterized protein YbjQ (UPF0145 family)